MRVTKINVRWFALLIAAVLSGLSTAAPLVENLAFQQVLPLYITQPAISSSVLERIQTEQKRQFIRLQTYGKPENFTAKAQLTFKTYKRSVAASIWPFVFQAPTEEGLLVNGWRGEGTSYFWRQDMDERVLPLAIPLVPENGAERFQLDYFNEFWLDYTSVSGLPLCVPKLEFKVSISSYSNNYNITASTSGEMGLDRANFKSIRTIDAARDNWKEKDYGYLVSRMFGFAPDEDWRYVQNQRHGVMQRRMHVQLDNIEVLDIAVAPNTVIERINLTVGQHDNNGSGELVEFDPLALESSMQNITFKDGRHVIRLNLSEALEKVFTKESAENMREPGKHHFYLQEIFFYIPGEASIISKSKPVRSLNFLERVKGERKQKSKPMLQGVTLASRFLGAHSFRQRMVVDMSELSEKSKLDLKSTKLLLLPPTGAASCAIRIKEKQVVRTRNGNIPSFGHVVGDWSRSRGSMLKTTLPQDEQIESPGIIGYFPLSTLVQDARQDGTVEVMIKPGTNKQLVPSTSVKTRLISSVGATLRAATLLPRVTTENDLLVLEGRSRALEISWPLTAHINNKTWFYFGVGEGVGQTGSIRLTLDLADGSVVQQQVLPNQPLHLMAGEAEVRNIRLLILPDVIPYRFKLREMVLFAPTTASYAQAFLLPLPTQYNVALKPVLRSAQASVLDVKPGHVSGMAPKESLHFSTPLNPVLDWARGVRLNYGFSPTYTGDQACSLSLQFNWENGKTERQVCFEKPNGALYIPMPNFIGGTDKLQNLGALRSIDWVLRPTTGGDKGVPESFYLQFSVDGWTMVSAADHLRLSPLFNVGRYPVFADAENSKEDATWRYAPKIWLPLEDKALPRMLAAGGEIQPAEHWLFTLDQVMAEPSQPMSRDRWRELTVGAASPGWLKWFVWLSVMLLALAIWKKRWWVWALARRSAKVLIRILGVAGRWGWHALPKINLAIGALALGPGQWLAFQYGESFVGNMLFVASVLIVWGAYCHWSEQTGQNWSKRDFIMPMRFMVLAGALGFTIWRLLVEHKFDVQTLWVFLPLLGAIYTYLPVLYRLGLLLVLNYRGYVLLGGWLVLALALYGGGLLIKVANEENYFFYFGMLALLFALREGLLTLEPNFRRFFPATAERVYGVAGSRYFFVALVMLVATMILLSIELQPIAEQLAIMAYFCLIIGTVQAVLELRKRDKKIVEAPNNE